MNTYLILKTGHILGAILFVGNIVVTAVWKAMADRTGDPRVIAFAQRLVTITDFVFTGAGAVLVLSTGLLMGFRYEGVSPWEVGWFVWGLALFGLSGLLWAAVLIPIQIRQARMARQFASGGGIPEAYRRCSRLWMAWGTAATILPFVNVYLMVFKPL